MDNQEAIEVIKLALSQVEWDYPMDYATAFDMAISALQAQDLQSTCNQLATDAVSRQAAIDALKGLPTWWADVGGHFGGSQPPMVALLDPEDAVSAIENLPSTQPEPCEDKLKEIADALSEKMRYINTCPNERDIILGYLGRKCSSKNHCNTDCWNEKCESYHYETKQQSEPCDDPRADVYYLAEKIGIHQLYALVVELRGEPKPCEDAVSRADVEIAIANILRGVFVEYQDIAKKTASKLPSVTPKRKTGKWKHISDGYVDIYECDQCRETEDYKRNYCPNCGAEMNGGE